MNRGFAIYAAIILLAFTGAGYKGYAFKSLFNNNRHGTAAGGSGGHFYHK